MPTAVRRLAAAAINYLSLREGVYSLGMADSGLLVEDPAALGGGGGLGTDRPVVLLVDRDWDVGGAALHGKSYRSCVVDVVGVDVHAVVVPGGDDEGGAASSVALPPPAGTKGGPPTHQLDERTDPFWAAHGEGPFWEVAAAVEDGLAAYTADVAALSSAPPSAVAAAAAADATAASVGGGAVPPSLSDALASLPALNARKATLDTHTRLASAVLTAVAGRGLAGLADLEAAVAAAVASPTTARQFLPAVVALLGVASPLSGASEALAAADAGTAPPAGAPTAADKARLAVTYAGRFGHLL
ncbi:hypothetical protein I4F81_002993 [Pyropia yezoensis]|uniref:Uncharacterized protein n=1 Tax=Pyropia yezoensis TaxID=2788 RepID=A0ACC3BQW7_PYRYE|nr:hypothetical protein I4F81_002993 [Neopyropia yezoensis]